MLRTLFSLHTFIALVFFGTLFSSFQESVHAGNTVTKERGTQAVLSWSVTGAPSCSTSFDGTDYPDNSSSEDTLAGQWIGLAGQWIGPKSSTGSTVSTKVLGNASLAFPQTYIFKCTDPISLVSDTATLTITDCASPKVWNGSACVAAPPAAGQCAALPNQCSVGTLGANAVQPNGDYHWYCDGVSGGATSLLCYASAIAPGQCGVSPNTCSVGTLGVNAVQPNGDYHWYCDGVSGGAASSLCTHPSTTGLPSGCGSGTLNDLCPSGDITPNSCVISSGQSSCSINVAWSTSNVTGNVEVRRNYDSGSVLATGANGNSSYIFPYSSSAYVLDLYGVTGNIFLDNASFSATCDGGLTWNGSVCTPSSLPSLSFSANPTSITSGDSSTLTWTVTDATSCLIDQGIGSVSQAGGTRLVSPVANTTYEITCSNASGNTSRTATVNVTGPSSPDLTASSPSPTSGTVNQNIPFSSTISNVGGASTGASFSSFFQWSTGPGGSGTVTDVAASSINTLSSGASSALTWNMVPASAGTFYIRACADKSSSGNSGSIDESNEGNNCSTWTTVTVAPEGTPPTSSGDITSNSCLIPFGQSSCSMAVAWTTANTEPGDIIQVRRTYDANSVLATGFSGNTSHSFPYASSPYSLNLFNLSEGAILDSATFATACSSGGWDTISSSCANPSVISAIVTGQYYEPVGTIAITCSNSSHYRVVHSETGTVVANNVPYPGSAVNVSVSLTGNYAVYCLQGSYTSVPEARYYNAGPPPSATVVLNASPRTIPRSSNSTISWTIQHPKSNCTLEARTICSSGACSADQTREAASLNNRILNEFTDSQNISDLVSPRTILSSLRTIPASRMNTDWKTTGHKTFNLKYSTEFVLNCGTSVSQAARVLITTTGER